MKKYICDKCQKELLRENDLREVLFLGKIKDEQIKNLELCEECRDKLQDLVKQFLTPSKTNKE